MTKITTELEGSGQHWSEAAALSTAVAGGGRWRWRCVAEELGACRRELGRLGSRGCDFG